jgi:hypothetical protein
MPVPVQKKSSRGGTIALVVAGFVAIAGLAFAAGRFTAPPAAAAGGPGTVRFPDGSFPPGASFGPGGGIFGGRGVLAGNGLTLRGEVTAISSDSITVKLDDGTSVDVPLNGSTTFHQSTSASATDVRVGDKVAVQAGAPAFNGSSPAPQASPGVNGGFRLGPATDVTVIED